jgi:hypothetical protein
MFGIWAQAMTRAMPKRKKGRQRSRL